MYDEPVEGREYVVVPDGSLSSTGIADRVADILFDARSYASRDADLMPYSVDHAEARERAENGDEIPIFFYGGDRRPEPVFETIHELGMSGLIESRSARFDPST